MELRNLTLTEISNLEQQRCSAQDWNRILVAPLFDPKTIRDTTFSGRIILGVFNKVHTLEGGVRRPSGIYNATLHECSIESDVLIERIGGALANCHIGEGTIIQNVHSIHTEGISFFGNKVRAAVMNETGGREVVIYNHLSSQVAYLMAIYRERKNLTAALYALVDRYASNIGSEIASIGRNCILTNCGTLRNVAIGDYAKVSGVTYLDNGTINSKMEAPTRVENGVIARNFIFAAGAVVTDGAQLNRAFIGQASHVGHQFSAHDSVIFSNCQFENGEGCAIFAGPYTVSMHKATLLIAAIYSFFNAGSGFNQSNHMYKLGPLHQGVVERGGRMSSDAYLLWPARIGLFSMVMGRHTNNSDTTHLPFSYLIQADKDSLLIPGATLERVGTVRDADKWPHRDGRKDPTPLDIINFELLNPYSVQKIVNGYWLLTRLKEEHPEEQSIYHYNGVVIKKGSLENGILYYKRAIERYLGAEILKRLASGEEIAKQLKYDPLSGTGDWVDLSGMIVPAQELDLILQRVESGSIVAIAELDQALKQLHSQYQSLSWNWSAKLLESWYGVSLHQIGNAEMIQILNNWNNAMTQYEKNVLIDAAKEFESASKVGFGIDGDEAIASSDFEAVRGSFEVHAFIIDLQNRSDHRKVKFSTIVENLTLR